MIAGDGPVPAAQPEPRRRRVRIATRGRFAAFLSSHFPLARASATLEFPRDGLAGARLHLPAGASVADPGAARVEVEVIWS